MPDNIQHRLSAPKILLGFYWQNTREPVSLLKVVDLLSECGWVVTPPIRVIQSHNGVIPKCTPFPMCWNCDARFDDTDSLPPSSANGADEWLPLWVFMDSPQWNVPVTVDYGQMHPASLKTADRYAVEITFGGADVDLVSNAPEHCSSGEIRNAMTTTMLSEFSFRLVCENLQPDYAAILFERPLLPPHSLIENACGLNFGRFYLSRAIYSDARALDEVGTLLHWRFDRFTTGTVFSPTASVGEASVAQGISFLRSALAREYSRRDGGP